MKANKLLPIACFFLFIFLVLAPFSMAACSYNSQDTGGAGNPGYSCTAPTYASWQSAGCDSTCLAIGYLYPQVQSISIGGAPYCVSPDNPTVQLPSAFYMANSGNAHVDCSAMAAYSDQYPDQMSTILNTIGFCSSSFQNSWINECNNYFSTKAGVDFWQCGFTDCPHPTSCAPNGLPGDKVICGGGPTEPRANGTPNYWIEPANTITNTCGHCYTGALTDDSYYLTYDLNPSYVGVNTSTGISVSQANSVVISGPVGNVTITDKPAGGTVASLNGVNAPNGGVNFGTDVPLSSDISNCDSNPAGYLSILATEKSFCLAYADNPEKIAICNTLVAPTHISCNEDSYSCMYNANPGTVHVQNTNSASIGVDHANIDMSNSNVTEFGSSGCFNMTWLSSTTVSVASSLISDKFFVPRGTQLVTVTDSTAGKVIISETPDGNRVPNSLTASNLTVTKELILTKVDGSATGLALGIPQTLASIYQSAPGGSALYDDLQDGDVISSSYGSIYYPDLINFLGFSPQYTPVSLSNSRLVLINSGINLATGSASFSYDSHGHLTGVTRYFPNMTAIDMTGGEAVKVTNGAIGPILIQSDLQYAVVHANNTVDLRNATIRCNESSNTVGIDTGARDLSNAGGLGINDNDLISNGTYQNEIHDCAYGIYFENNRKITNLSSVLFITNNSIPQPAAFYVYNATVLVNQSTFKTKAAVLLEDMANATVSKSFFNITSGRIGKAEAPNPFTTGGILTYILFYWQTGSWVLPGWSAGTFSDNTVYYNCAGNQSNAAFQGIMNATVNISNSNITANGPLVDNIAGLFNVMNNTINMTATFGMSTRSVYMNGSFSFLGGTLNIPIGSEGQLNVVNNKITALPGAGYAINNVNSSIYVSNNNISGFPVSILIQPDRSMSLITNNNIVGILNSPAIYYINVRPSPNNNSVIANTISNDSMGIYAINSSNLLFSNNIITNSSSAGIDFQNSLLSYSTISGNNISTGLDGISLFNSSYLTMNSNNLFNNLGYGLGIFDSSYVTASDFHLYNNSAGDLYISKSLYGSTLSIRLLNMSIDNPAGNYENYTRVSIIDNTLGQDEGLSNPNIYVISWAKNTTSLPAGLISFRQKFVNITQPSGSGAIDTLIFSWFSSETTGYNEHNFDIWRYDSRGWAKMNATLDTGAHTLTLHDVAPGSTYGILVGNCTANGDGCGINSDCCTDYCNGGTCDCAPLAGSCTSGSDCCSPNFCNPLNDTCVSCLPSGASTPDNASCCSGISYNGLCVTCLPSPAPCTAGGDCCSGSCNGITNTCDCTTAPGACTDNSSCCTNYCNAGNCDCNPLNFPCANDSDCCAPNFCEPQNNTCVSCLALTDTCASDSDCCSGLCDPFSHTCVSCLGSGAGCTGNSSCCTDYCNSSSQCDCLVDNLACTSNQSCCSKYCNPFTNICDCTASGQLCTGNSQCCSNFCNSLTSTCGCFTNGTACTSNASCCSNLCDPLSSTCVTCLSLTESCASNSDCCSGYCDLGTNTCAPPLPANITQLASGVHCAANLPGGAGAGIGGALDFTCDYHTPAPSTVYRDYFDGTTINSTLWNSPIQGSNLTIYQNEKLYFNGTASLPSSGNDSASILFNKTFAPYEIILSNLTVQLNSTLNTGNYSYVQLKLYDPTTGSNLSIMFINYSGIVNGYASSLSPVTANGRNCTNGLSGANHITFVGYGSGGGFEDIDHDGQLSTIADPTTNYDVACLDATGAFPASTDNTTGYFDSRFGLNNCSDVSALTGGLNCYGFAKSVLIGHGAGNNFTFNATAFNSTFNITPGYTYPPYLNYSLGLPTNLTNFVVLSDIANSSGSYFGFGQRVYNSFGWSSPEGDSIVLKYDAGQQTLAITYTNSATGLSYNANATGLSFTSSTLFQIIAGASDTSSMLFGIDTLIIAEKSSGPQIYIDSFNATPTHIDPYFWTVTPSYSGNISVSQHDGLIVFNGTADVPEPGRDIAELSFNQPFAPVHVELDNITADLRATPDGANQSFIFASLSDPTTNDMVNVLFMNDSAIPVTLLLQITNETGHTYYLPLGPYGNYSATNGNLTFDYNVATQTLNITYSAPGNYLNSPVTGVNFTSAAKFAVAAGGSNTSSVYFSFSRFLAAETQYTPSPYLGHLPGAACNVYIDGTPYSATEGTDNYAVSIPSLGDGTHTWYCSCSLPDFESIQGAPQTIPSCGSGPSGCEASNSCELVFNLNDKACSGEPATFTAQKSIGTPLSEVSASFYYVNDDGSTSPAVLGGFVFSTNSSGEVTFTPSKPGKYTAKLSKPGYVSKSYDFQVNDCANNNCTAAAVPSSGIGQFDSAVTLTCNNKTSTDPTIKCNETDAGTVVPFGSGTPFTASRICTYPPVNETTIFNAVVTVVNEFDQKLPITDYPLGCNLAAVPPQGLAPFCSNATLTCQQPPICNDPNGCANISCFDGDTPITVAFNAQGQASRDCCYDCASLGGTVLANGTCCIGPDCNLPPSCTTPPCYSCTDLGGTLLANGTCCTTGNCTPTCPGPSPCCLGTVMPDGKCCTGTVVNGACCTGTVLSDGSCCTGPDCMNCAAQGGIPMANGACCKGAVLSDDTCCTSGDCDNCTAQGGTIMSDGKCCTGPECNFCTAPPCFSCATRGGTLLANGTCCMTDECKCEASGDAYIDGFCRNCTSTDVGGVFLNPDACCVGPGCINCNQTGNYLECLNCTAQGGTVLANGACCMGTVMSDGSCCNGPNCHIPSCTTPPCYSCTDLHGTLLTNGTCCTTGNCNNCTTPDCTNCAAQGGTLMANGTCCTGTILSDGSCCTGSDCKTCTAQGGIPMANGACCKGAVLSDDTCCTSGNCMNCAAQGGTIMPDGTCCTGPNCKFCTAPPCFSCTEMGGTVLANGTCCTGPDCNVPPSCTTPPCYSCTDLHGTLLTNGTCCTTGNCNNCTTPDCTNCAAQGGTLMANGTCCTGTILSDGSCCTGSDCKTCTAQGGIPMANGACCKGAVLSDDTCCTSGNCMNCAAQGGTIMPDGTCCTGPNCKFCTAPPCFSCTEMGGTVLANGTCCMGTVMSDGTCCTGSDCKVCQENGGVILADGTCKNCTKDLFGKFIGTNACCIGSGCKTCESIGGTLMSDGSCCTSGDCVTHPPKPPTTPTTCGAPVTETITATVSSQSRDYTASVSVIPAAALGEQCSSDGQCCSGFCDNGICKQKPPEVCKAIGTACNITTECCPGTVCSQGVCKVCGGIGETCSITGDCCRGYCSENKCIEGPAGSQLVSMPDWMNYSLWTLLAVLSATAAYSARKEQFRLIPFGVFAVPMAVGFVSIVFIGVAVALTEIAAFALREKNYVKELLEK